MTLHKKSQNSKNTYLTPTNLNQKKIFFFFHICDECMEKPWKNRHFFTKSLLTMASLEKTQKFHLHGLRDLKTFHLHQKSAQSVNKWENDVIFTLLSTFDIWLGFQKLTWIVGTYTSDPFFRTCFFHFLKKTYTPKNYFFDKNRFFRQKE